MKSRFNTVDIRAVIAEINASKKSNMISNVIVVSGVYLLMMCVCVQLASG